jgi:hypothetical protein
LEEKSLPVGVLLLCFVPINVFARYDDDMLAPNSGPGVLLLKIEPVPLVVVRMSRALRDHAVCRSNVFIVFDDNSVSMIGVDVSALFGKRKLRLLS